MTIALDIPPEIEVQVRQVAAEQGKHLEAYLLDLIQHAVADQASASAVQPETEADLLEQINRGLAPASWQRYHELRAKHQAQTLTPTEHQELIALSDEREQANVQRVAALIRLAHLRQTSVDALMTDLGLHPPTDE